MLMGKISLSFFVHRLTKMANKILRKKKKKSTMTEKKREQQENNRRDGTTKKIFQATRESRAQDAKFLDQGIAGARRKIFGPRNCRITKNLAPRNRGITKKFVKPGKRGTTKSGMWRISVFPAPARVDVTRVYVWATVFYKPTHAGSKRKSARSPRLSIRRLEGSRPFTKDHSLLKT